MGYRTKEEALAARKRFLLRKMADPAWREKHLAYQRKYSAEYYRKSEKRRRSMRRRSEERRLEVQRYLWAYKTKVGCVDCGYNAHPVALDFDHVSGTKVRILGLCRSMKSMKEEIVKCVVRCANCHRIKTFNALPERKAVV